MDGEGKSGADKSGAGISGEGTIRPERHVRPSQRLFYYFLFCAFSGQVYEVLLDNLWYHHPWQWQGPLHGPWLIIYGVGGAALLVMLERHVGRRLMAGPVNIWPLVIAIVIFLIAGSIEYVGHWLLDTFFDFRPWDYSAKPMNINGRTCLEDVLRFTVLGMVELYLVMPVFERFFDRVSKPANRLLFAVLAGAFALDIALSFGILLFSSG